MNSNKNTSKPKKVYFASDFHLGVPNHKESLEREKKLVKWLNTIEDDALEIFLLGDIFDFWFEYSTAVPKGFVRILGKLAELTDKGIPIHLFRGNHDIWAFEYLQKEVGIKLHRRPQVREFYGKKFLLAHGDGLGPGDNGYKLLKKVFEFKPNQWLFKILHPDIGTRLGLYFSRKSRIANVALEGSNTYIPPKPEEENLYIYSKDYLEKDSNINYFIFGHRHIILDHAITNSSRLVILGDWVTNYS
ncbi:MAG: UDP-2,3-diacylglucosamine diphosphatase, partial [Bacteroidales bacterium]